MADVSGLKQLFSSTTIDSLLTDRTTFFIEPTATIGEAVQLLTDKQIQSGIQSVHFPKKYTLTHPFSASV